MAIGDISTEQDLEAFVRKVLDRLPGGGGGVKPIAAGSASLGTGGAGINSFTVSFGSTLNVVPHVVCSPHASDGTTDTFAHTIRNVTTAQFVVDIYRADVAGAAWGLGISLDWLAFA